MDNNFFTDWFKEQEEDSRSTHDENHVCDEVDKMEELEKENEELKYTVERLRKRIRGLVHYINKETSG